MNQCLVSRKAASPQRRTGFQPVVPGKTGWKPVLRHPYTERSEAEKT